MPMLRFALRMLTAALFATGLLACASLGGASSAPTFTPDPAARAPKLEGFGQAAWRIATSSDGAQDLFARGLLQLYAFNQVEAARAFKGALAKDPHCAMCAWGVAMALGPNINAVERGDLAEARQYAALAERETRRTGGAAGSDGARLERLLVEAVVARYGEAADGGERNAAAALPDAPICSGGNGPPPHPLDVRYAARMLAVADAFPNQPDVASLYAEARMIATRVDWWDPVTGEPAPGIADMTARLERALLQARDHTGLNHYLIHAVDAVPVARRAEAAADRLGTLAPASPHLLHMPAHIYVRLGRWSDAVRVNVDGIAADVEQKRVLEAQGFEPSPDWNGHNLHFLWYAALMDGRGDQALATARRLAERSATRETATGEFMRALPLFTLARIERWTEVLAAPMPPSTTGLATAIAHQARGLALLRLGRLDEASAEAVALEAAIASTTLDDQKVFGADPAREVLAILRARLEAEFAVARGRPDAAGRALDQAVAREDALEANEPPLLGAGSRLALGDAWGRAGRWSEAQTAYRADLAEHPHSGWAWRGLTRALSAAGRPEQAAQARIELGRTWASADPALRAATNPSANPAPGPTSKR